MALLRVNDFGGVAPIIDAAKLPERSAQIAGYCRFEGGNLRPLRAVATTFTPPTQGYNTKTIYQLGTNQWLRWNADVSVARGPIAVQSGYLGLGADWRFYFTGDGLHFETWPRFSSKYRAMGNSDPSTYFTAPAIDYPLGVPPPQSSMTAAVSAAPTGTVSTLRKGSPVQVECTAAHGLAYGNKVSLSGLPGSGDGSELAGVSYAISVVSETIFKLDSADGSDWAADVTGLSATWTRVYSDSDLEDRVYVMTYVNEFGEEGAPGPASDIVSVGVGQSVTLTTPTGAYVTPSGAPVTLQFQVTAKRIYRSVAGSTETQYLFVAEIPIATVTYADSLDYAALGEVLPTEGFDLPPENLSGIVLHPDGFMVGFVNNRLFFSEPYLPYAWPEVYAQALDFNIIGLAIFGKTIVVITDGQPYLVHATDPQSATKRMIDQVYPGVSRRAIVSTGKSVVYVSPAGLVVVDEGGARVTTSDYYSRLQWADLLALGTDWFLCWQDSKVWMGIEGARMVMFDMRSNTRLDIVPSIAAAYAGFVNRATDELYLMWGGSLESTRRLYKWDGNPSSNYIATWRSKTFHMDRERNFGWAQVFAPSYPTSGAQTMTLTVYADGVEKHSQDVTSQNPFPLPSGFLARDWYFDIESTIEIESIQIAESVEELRRIGL